ncbi:MAG: hypothetical protein JW969_16840 [Spirochaetales bacterium]|nr:hypothetical protein [Spirochaetales bacterium]
MMKALRSKIVIALVLMVISAGLYFIHFLIFHDEHHILIYFIGDVAFLPIEVLLVSLVIENIISRREKKERIEKLNMIIESFFSEFGKDLLEYMSRFNKNLDKIRSMLTIDDCDKQVDFGSIFKTLKAVKGNIDIDAVDLKKLEKFLRKKRQFLLGLLQNPNLLEHESFTESLMSVFHITEELAARNLAEMTDEDLSHTKKDLERAYNYLTVQWVKYIEYTQKHYPYFFLFAVQTNPFDRNSPWINSWFDCAENA